MKILKEPLLHFLVIGAAFFGLYSYLNPEAMNSDRRIVVDAGRINSIEENFRKTWNRDPNADELKGLVHDYVLEEIYYRQALALGIDQNDAMIRRRLRQKMEFLSTSIASSIEPSQQELEAYLNEHQDKYQESNLYTFEQVYINPDRSLESLNERIAEIQAQLQEADSVKGDPTLLLPSFENATDFQVNNRLGRDFSSKLDELPLNQWSGPVQSGLGIHFIRLTSREVGQLPPLDKVRAEVVRDWSYEKSLDVKQKVSEGLLSEYQVVVEWPKGVES